MIESDRHSQIIRKVRAQTLLDGMARELIPFVTKALSIINPNKDDIFFQPAMLATGALAVGTNLNNFDQDSKEPWSFNRQVDYLIGICQSGLYVLNPKSILEIAHQSVSSAAQPAFNSLVQTLCRQAPFSISAENQALIEKLVPHHLAHYEDEATSNNDQIRFFKLARIIFLLFAYEVKDIEPYDPKHGIAEFNKKFPILVKNGLTHFGFAEDFSPNNKSEETDGFIAINRFMDENFIEPRYEAAIRKFLGRASKEINFRQVSLKTVDKTVQQHFIKDGRHHALLDELATELSNGSQSIVGGRDYPRFRFAESILKRIVLGIIPVVIIDGTKSEAESLMKAKYFDDAESVLAIDTCGQYGDFTKTLYQITDKKGDKRFIFCIAQPGELRVLSNAAALLLYSPKKTEAGQNLATIPRIVAEDITCYYRATPLNTIISKEIDELLNISVDHPFSKTVVMPATSAATILIELEEQGLILSKIERTLSTCGRSFIVLIKNPESNLISRVLIPSVGGAGLYGDTAATFVEEYLKKTVTDDGQHKLSTDIKFFATAGAIRSEAFRFNEGDLVTPTRNFIAYDKSSKLQVPNVSLNDPQIATYQDHGWAPCPAVETNRGLETLIADSESSISMIDVEGLPIAAAVQKHNLHASNEMATFTPIYVVSDTIDAKRPIPVNKHDYNSYAYGCRVGMALHLTAEQSRAIARYLAN